VLSVNESVDAQWLSERGLEDHTTNDSTGVYDLAYIAPGSLSECGLRRLGQWSRRVRCECRRGTAEFPLATGPLVASAHYRLLEAGKLGRQLRRPPPQRREYLTSISSSTEQDALPTSTRSSSTNAEQVLAERGAPGAPFVFVTDMPLPHLFSARTMIQTPSQELLLEAEGGVAFRDITPIS
jgi:hypothetical protein